MSLLAELQRRKVFRVAAAYLVVGWLLIQVAATVLPQFDVPAWAPRLVTLLVALGFPVALAAAWALESTPDGVKLDSAGAGGKRLLVILVAMIALTLGWYFRGQSAPQVAANSASRPSTPAAAPVAPAAKKSIAVLPFVNFSTDPENEFFSDGLSEEILNSLARIDGMQVVGRTSSFQFKGKNEDLRTIGLKLGVATVLEGSVRREGERARITAQLIRTSDGIHLWSETYDRTVKDSLAVQLDIAEKVADALDVVLDDKQRARMRQAGVKDVDAFIAYQKGLKLYNEAHSKPDTDFIAGMRLANAEFAKATALDPDFSLAYFAAADLYEHQLLSDATSPADRIEAQRQALKTLDLAAATGHDEQQRLLTLAERQMLSDDWRGLPARIDAAFSAPGCNASNWLPVFASAFGYGDAIESLGARASACDPLNFINFSTRAWVARATGSAQRVFDVMAAAEKVRGNPARNSAHVARAMMLQGRLDDARKLLDGFGPDARDENYALALAVLGRARGEEPGVVHAQLQALDRTRSRYHQWWLADAVEAALSGDRVEANRRAAAIDALPAGGLQLAVLIVECQCGAPFDLDATPRFKARLAESGLRWPPPETIHFPPRATPATP